MLRQYETVCFTGIPILFEENFPFGQIDEIGDRKMSAKRKIEIFSAGCPVCREAIAAIKSNACASCDVSVLDMNDPGVLSRARQLGIKSIPAVVIDGRLADCCAGRGPDIEVLKGAGLGVPLS